jgi:RecJ-like exonuclease
MDKQRLVESEQICPACSGRGFKYKPVWVEYQAWRQKAIANDAAIETIDEKTSRHKRMELEWFMEHGYSAEQVRAGKIPDEERCAGCSGKGRQR